MKGTFSNSSHRGARSACSEQLEHVLDETGVPAVDAGGAARLAQVLTREPGGDEVALGERVEREDVASQRR